MRKLLAKVLWRTTITICMITTGLVVIGLLSGDPAPKEFDEGTRRELEVITEELQEELSPPTTVEINPRMEALRQQLVETLGSKTMRRSYALSFIEGLCKEPLYAERRMTHTAQLENFISSVGNDERIWDVILDSFMKYVTEEDWSAMMADTDQFFQTDAWTRLHNKISGDIVIRLLDHLENSGFAEPHEAAMMRISVTYARDT